MSIDDGDISIVEEVIEVEVHCSYIKKDIVDWVNHVERVYGQSFVCPIPNARQFKPQDLRRAKHYRYDIWGYRYLVAAAFRAHPVFNGFWLTVTRTRQHIGLENTEKLTRR
jgi:hypothetical protein